MGVPTLGEDISLYFNYPGNGLENFEQWCPLMIKLYYNFSCFEKLKCSHEYNKNNLHYADGFELATEVHSDFDLRYKQYTMETAPEG